MHSTSLVARRGFCKKPGVVVRHLCAVGHREPVPRRRCLHAFAPLETRPFSRFGAKSRGAKSRGVSLWKEERGQSVNLGMLPQLPGFCCLTSRCRKPQRCGRVAL